MVLQEREKANSTVKMLVKPKNVNTITTKLPYQHVYEWASKLTAEQKGWDEVDFYYWTPKTEHLFRRLLLSRGNLIAVVGLQGSGKTHLRMALWSKLKRVGKQNVYTFRFYEGSLENEVINSTSSDILKKYAYELCYKIYDKMGNNQFLKLIEKNFGNSTARAFRRIIIEGKKAEDYDFGIYDYIHFFEKVLGRKTCNEVMKDLVLEEIREADCVLIDLPDYDKRNRREMIKDLYELQTFWEGLFFEGEPPKVNIVLFLQKELFEGHFFFGKLDVVNLEPLKPEEMVQIYVKKFGSTKPFKDEILLELAKMSRGIFRRFLKYIGSCLDVWYDQGSKGEIDSEILKQAVSFEQRVKDMELELMDLFPKEKTNIRKAVQLLDYLRQKGEVNQKTISEELFNGNLMAASRMINKLEAHDYIQVRKVGKENFVKLC